MLSLCFANFANWDTLLIHFEAFLLNTHVDWGLISFCSSSVFFPFFCSMTHLCSFSGSQLNDSDA